MKALTGFTLLLLARIASAGWFAVESGTTADLRDVEYLELYDRGVAVGDSGVILVSHEGNWQRAENPSAANLTAVSVAPNTSACVAVGAEGTILVTSNAGDQWEVVGFQPGWTYYDVIALDPQNVVAVGDSGGVSTRLTITEDGWETARSIHLSLDYFGRPDLGTLVSIVMLNPTDGVVCARRTDGSTAFLLTTDGWNSTWIPISGELAINKLVMPSSARAITVGDNGTILHGNGYGFPQGWSVVQTDCWVNLRGISERTSGPIWMVGDQGNIWISISEGWSWEQQPSGTTRDLNAVYARSRDVAFVVGEHGTILMTTDAGGYRDDRPSEFEILSPSSGSLIPRAEYQFAWTRSTNDFGYRVSYSVSIVVDSVEFPYWVDDTTMSFNFANLQEFRDHRITAFFFVQAMDSLGGARDANNSPVVFTLEADLSADAARPLPEHAQLIIAPNPFNATTTVRYSLDSPQRISLDIFDTAGRLVQTLVQSEQSAGTHQVNLHAQHLASGIYFARLQTESSLQYIKLVLLK